MNVCYVQKPHKNMISRHANFCCCGCFYNSAPISWALNLNRQCPSTGSASQCDRATHSVTIWYRPRPTPIASLVSARLQFVCFSPFSSQTVLAICIPRYFLHFSKRFYVSVCLHSPGVIFKGVSVCLHSPSVTRGHFQGTHSRITFLGRAVTHDAAAAWLRMGLAHMSLKDELTWDCGTHGYINDLNIRCCFIWL